MLWGSAAQSSCVPTWARGSLRCASLTANFGLWLVGRCCGGLLLGLRARRSGRTFGRLAGPCSTLLVAAPGVSRCTRPLRPLRALLPRASCSSSIAATPSTPCRGSSFLMLLRRGPRAWLGSWATGWSTRPPTCFGVRGARVFLWLPPRVSIRVSLVPCLVRDRFGRAPPANARPAADSLSHLPGVFLLG